MACTSQIRIPKSLESAEDCTVSQHSASGTMQCCSYQQASDNVIEDGIEGLSRPEAIMPA